MGPLGSYFKTDDYNTSAATYLTTSNFNNTIGSYLKTANFTSTIGSYLKTSDYNTSAATYLTISAFNNTTSSQLSLKGDITNPSFFNNVGINTSSPDSALHILGPRTTSPNTKGIRLGYASDAFPISTESYGIEICSGTDTNGGGTIDFTYPFGPSSSYYAGRMFFENNNAFFGWNCNYTPATGEGITSPYQMTIDRFGNLTVQNQINVPNLVFTGNLTATSICLNGTDIQTSLATSNIITDSIFVSGASNLNAVSCNSIFMNASSTANTNFYVGAALRVNGTQLNIGAVSFNSTLNVSGAATLSSSLNTIGNITSSNLRITGNITTSGTIQTTYLSVLQTATIPKLNVPTTITTSSIFVQNGGSISCPATFKTFTDTGFQTWNAGTITSAFSDSFNGLYSDTILTKYNFGGDAKLTLQNQSTGTTSLYFSTNGTVNSRLYQDPLGNVNFNLNISNTSVLPLSLYSNGVVNVNGNNAISNKVLVLYENASGDTPATATNYSGIGIQTGGAMRYQVPTSTTTHRFFCGTTQSFFITNGTGASGSDIRFKSDIQDITNALDKVKQLQGKTFNYQECGRQMGMIAQEVKPIVPEVVMQDEDGYHFMAYDRLVALLIESVKELSNEIEILKNKI